MIDFGDSSWFMVLDNIEHAILTKNYSSANYFCKKYRKTFGKDEIFELYQLILQKLTNSDISNENLVELINKVKTLKKNCSKNLKKNKVEKNKKTTS